MTTIAAPRALISFAFLTNSASPSFRLIEFTTDFPWAFFSPARRVFSCDESIISAALATLGSFEMCRVNTVISFSLSSMASSRLMSMTVAPSSICPAATDRASSYFFSDISLANFRDPATFVLSPIFVNLFRATSMVTVSSPLNFSGSCPSSDGISRGAIPFRASAIALIWAGVVPQHPPAMFRRPSDAIAFMSAAIFSGDSS